jgi:uncharacterized protein YndB with AHSA1/START domain
MPDIYQDFPIKVAPQAVYHAVSTAQGLDCWWTKRSSGNPKKSELYELWFGPRYDWRAEVTACEADRVFELQMVSADPDWLGTRVGFHLENKAGTTWIRFHHTGWPNDSEHFRVSCHCWALYLRILRRYLEHGEFVPYDDRLDA